MSDLDELKQILDIIIPRDGEIEGMTAELHDKAVETVKAKINRLLIEARIEELKWADGKFDSLLQATEDGDRVHPGEYFEAIEDRIKTLSNNLSKGDMK